nr:hypothetical protein [Gordonia polyisoprenivorans]
MAAGELGECVTRYLDDQLVEPGVEATEEGAIGVADNELPRREHDCPVFVMEEGLTTAPEIEDNRFRWGTADVSATAFNEMRGAGDPGQPDAATFGLHLGGQKRARIQGATTQSDQVLVLVLLPQADPVGLREIRGTERRRRVVTDSSTSLEGRIIHRSRLVTPR